MTKEEALSLRSGDRVLLTQSHYGAVHSDIATVVRITPAGRIRCNNDKLYDTEGKEVTKETFHRSWIEVLTPERIQKYKETQHIRKFVSSMRYGLETKNLTYDKVIRIEAILKEGRE